MSPEVTTVLGEVCCATLLKCSHHGHHLVLNVDIYGYVHSVGILDAQE